VLVGWVLFSPVGYVDGCEGGMSVCYLLVMLASE
jgi:hypothetical protein